MLWLSQLPAVFSCTRELLAQEVLVRLNKVFNTNWKWRMFAFKVKVVGQNCRQHLQGRTFTLKATCLHFQ